MFSLALAIVPAFLVLALASQPPVARHSLSKRLLFDNTSALPPGWSGAPQCLADCGSPDPVTQFMLGPAFVNSTGMTIELCVEFCDQQNSRMAGLLGDECRCSNMFNPATCFESDFNECEEFGDPCVGNPVESCGSVTMAPHLINIFFKQELCGFLFEGGVQLTSGPWRFAWFFTDTVGARALGHNAVDLHPSLPRGNLSVDACLSTCAANGFSLAGVEFADECYCGNSIENNSHPISECNGTIANSAAMRCKGDPNVFCGGPNLLYVYMLPGANLSITPLVPFDRVFDGFCGSCNEFGAHT